MKKSAIKSTFGFIFMILTLATSAQMGLKTSIPDEVQLLQNPFKPMNILVIPANIEGITAQQGDLVMAFDGETCVGAAVIEDVNKILNLVATSTDEVNKGYKAGQTIRLEYHSIFENTVYNLSPSEIMLGSMNYEELGTLYADFKATTLNINENNTNQIKVYPNPVSHQLHIVLELDKVQQGEELTLRLIDIQGKVVIKKELQANQSIFNLDVTTLQTGEYNLIISNSKTQFSQKVIKK